MFCTLWFYTAINKGAEVENISIQPPAECVFHSEKGIYFEEFVTYDDGVITARTLSDEENINSVAQITKTID